jgi:predicted nucleotidyltransferase
LQTNHPTKYPEINKLLDLLLKNEIQVLGNQLAGMYLYGSLSSGEFDLETSDIDFLVVTSSTLPDKTIAELEAMHHRMWESGSDWAKKLEGSYVPKREIKRQNQRSGACPTVNEGRFYLDNLGSDWIIQRHIVREQGVILAGPDPKTLIDPVSAAELRQAVKGVLNEWWFPMLEDPTWLREHGSEYHAYTILTMCRALYTLENGSIVSKSGAARWVQGKLGEDWSKIIDQALIAQKPSSEHYDLYRNALQLIRITKEFVTAQT